MQRYSVLVTVDITVEASSREEAEALASSYVSISPAAYDLEIPTKVSWGEEFDL